MVGTSQQSARLGFIGVGAMGLPMVGRLVAAGYSVTAWDHAPERLVAAERAGANVAGTAAAVARATEVVFLCLTDAAAVEMVICGPDGVSSVPAPGKLVVDFSSIPPDSACSIAARLNAMNGMSWIDAPVSGGPPGAANGTLAVMAGGEATDIERVKPYVLVMAQRVTHMGPIGAGQTTKLCNQIIAACAMVVLAEATRFAVDAGIDAARLPEALAGGFAELNSLADVRPPDGERPGSTSDRRRLHHPQGPRHDRRCRARTRDAPSDGKSRSANVPAAEFTPRSEDRCAGNLWTGRPAAKSDYRRI